jgi:hypothetical protein
MSAHKKTEKRLTLSEIVARLYNEAEDASSTEKDRIGSYRALATEFKNQATLGQKARWVKLQHDPGFKEHETSDEEITRFVVGEPERDFSMGDNLTARWTAHGINLVYNSGTKNEHEAKVIVGCIEPIARLRVDDDIYFRWVMDGAEVIARVDDLLDDLRGRGAILLKSRAQDALSAVATGMVEHTETRHATYGVYADGDLLRLCEDPQTVKDEQAKTWEEVKPNIQTEASKERIETYVEMIKAWHPFEVLPAFGLALAAPFTPVLRREGVLVPHIFHYAPESDLGKSLVALVASLKLFGVSEISGEGIDSQFRLAAELDSVALPIAVDEADKLNNRVLPIVKESAERWICAKRGTKELGMIRYASRGVLIMTGNELPTQSESVLKRILTVRFDASAKRARRMKAQEVRKTFNALKPIGFDLVRRYMLEHPDKAGLLATIQGYASEIEAARVEWASPQRPSAWAVVYFGLKIFEKGCRAVGIAWEAPATRDFVESVVDPVEATTWESRRTNVERFVDFFEMWRTTHTRRVQGTHESWNEVQGKDEIWKETALVVSGETVEGFYVTSPLLDEYNRQHTRLPGEGIPSLKELAIQGADQAGIPNDQVLDSSHKQCPLVKFSGHPKRSAFVCISEPTRAHAHIRVESQKPCSFVTDDEPASQKEGNIPMLGTLPEGEPARKTRTLPMGPSKDVVEEVVVTQGNTELHDNVTYEKDILDESRNINSNKVTSNPGPQCARAREGVDQERPSTIDTETSTKINGKLAVIEEKLREEVDKQEARLKSVFRESWPYVTGLVEDCRDAIERGDRWGAFQIRAFAERFDPKPNPIVSELLANDEQGWQRAIKQIASFRLIEARKGDAP